MEKENKTLDENLNEEAEGINENTYGRDTSDSADDLKEKGSSISSNVSDDMDKSEESVTSEAADSKDNACSDTGDTVKEADEKSKSSDADGTDSDKKKKKPFKKKDKKDQQIEELNDKYQRLFAEFQNFRARSEKEKSAMFEVGAKSIIEKILPVVDNFERGIGALSEEDLGSPVGEGMNLIYKQMTAALTEMGVTVIETEGKEFNPELHNAVMHEDNEELGENMISQEFQKGYKYRDTVIRHSMVKVAN